MNSDVSMAINVACMECIYWLCGQEMGQTRSNPFRVVRLMNRVCAYVRSPSEAAKCGDAVIILLACRSWVVLFNLLFVYNGESLV